MPRLTTAQLLLSSSLNKERFRLKTFIIAHQFSPNAQIKLVMLLVQLDLPCKTDICDLPYLLNSS